MRPSAHTQPITPTAQRPTPRGVVFKFCFYAFKECGWLRVFRFFFRVLRDPDLAFEVPSVCCIFFGDEAVGFYLLFRG